MALIVQLMNFTHHMWFNNAPCKAAKFVDTCLLYLQYVISGNTSFVESLLHYAQKPFFATLFFGRQLSDAFSYVFHHIIF